MGQFLSGMVITLIGEHVGGLSSALVVIGVTSMAAGLVSLVVGMRTRRSVPAVLQ